VKIPKGLELGFRVVSLIIMFFPLLYFVGQNMAEYLIIYLPCYLYLCFTTLFYYLGE